MTFYSNIHGPQRMNPSDFVNPPTFHLAPPAGQNFTYEISPRLPDGLA